MEIPAVPPNEEQRIAAIRELGLLDDVAEPELDDITSLAASICQMPISLITVLETNRQLFKSHFGLSIDQTPRDIAFCGHAVLSNELFEVPDTLKDKRFHDNPLVTGSPNIRFYAGQPLITKEGLALGTICVLDTKPGSLNTVQKKSLEAFGRQIVMQFELRAVIRQEHNRACSLKESEHRFRLLMDTMTEGMVVRDHTGKIVQINTAAINILGVDESEALGSSLINPKWTIVKPDGSKFQPEQHPAMLALRTRQRQLSVTLGLQKSSEETAWMNVNAVPIHWKEGHGVLTTFNDVTEIVRDREALANRTRQLDEFFNLSVDLMCMAGADTTFRRVNSSFERVLGFSNEELVGKSFLQFIHSEDIQDTIKEVQNLTAGMLAINFTNRYRCKTGSYRLLCWSATYDPKSGLIYAAARDVTAERDRELQLEQSASRLEEAQRTAKIGSWETDLETNSYIWSNEYYRIFEINVDLPSDAARLEYESRFLKGDLGGLNEKIERSRNDGLGFTVDHRLIFDGGLRVKYVRTIGRVMPNLKGRSSRVVGTCQDRTSEVLLEQSLELERAKSLQSAKLASLGEMSAGVAHEINNPLAIISGTAYFMLKILDEPHKLRGKLEIIEKAVQRIAKIVSGLNKFSRSSTAQDLKECSISDMVSEAFGLIGTKPDRLGVDVFLDVDDNLSIHCNEIEIEQVLVNLINNALDAAKDSEDRWVTVRAQKAENKIVIQVVDSGPGVTHEVREKLFQPFFTTKPVGQGTGLGLAIARGIMRAHKAEINVLEFKGNTCFELVFEATSPDHLLSDGLHQAGEIKPVRAGANLAPNL